MRVVSSVLRKTVYPVLHRCGFFARGISKGSCLVVNYHGVVPTSPYQTHRFLDGNLVAAATLRDQIRLLRNKYHIIAPHDFRKWLHRASELPERAVLITCDDGLVNNVTDMLPILLDEGVCCLFFITGESCREHPGMLWYEELYCLLENSDLGVTDADEIFGADPAAGPADLQSRWWRCVIAASRMTSAAREARIQSLRSAVDIPLPGPETRERWQRMTPEELHLIVDAGMTIGAHTQSHPVLAQCSEDEARNEVCQSKIELERLSGQEVWAFAYPFGNPSTMGDRELKLASEAGFECAFVNVRGGSVDPSQPFSLARTHVTSGMSLAEFEAHLSGFHSRLQAAFKR